MKDLPTTDLTNCDREPIHLLGAIQPTGVLIAVSRAWIIERVSANLADLFELQPQDAVGRNLDSLLIDEALHEVRNRATLLVGPDAVERAFGLRLRPNDDLYDLVLHVSDDLIVLEVERAQKPPGDATNMVRTMLARLDRSHAMETFLQEGARLIRGLAGYDRVMVYRFDSEGSGEVVAEAMRAGIGSFKGLRYPASDIPRQARVLYKRNLIRTISDVDAVPAPIVPQADARGRPLDLSLSALRSVSPIHIEYLKNMGVGASMSISIIVDDELWGLFACHHYASRALDFNTRAVCELFAQMFSMRLESRERRELMEFERRARDISDTLLGAVANDDSLLNNPDWLSSILTEAIPADGVGVWINGTSVLSGATPSTGQFRKLIGELTKASCDKVFATDHIGGFMAGAEAFASEAAGMLAIPISRSARDYVVIFRREIVRSVRWGGDPHKPVEFGPNGPRLTPRQSFEEWKETVRGRAKPFNPSEVRVAETLRATLIEVVLRLADEAATQRQSASERQEVLIAELNHRVRNILGVIRGLIRQSKPADGELESFVKQVDGRIHALARAHNQITDDHWGPAPIQALVDAETGAFLADSPDRVSTSGGFVLLNPQAYSTMALVFHELITNSAKYGSLSGDGAVEITWRRDNSGNLVVEWVETGGPPVTPPERRGFGTTIIDRSVPYDLGGEASIDYAPAGVRARFSIPARHVSEASAGRQPLLRSPRKLQDRSVAPAQILAAKTVLIVEDSLIIALDAEDVVKKLGAEGVMTAASVAAGLQLLDEPVKPDIAMLDINLGDKSSFPIADRLRALDIPFLFASGYGEQAHLPAAHAERLVVQKPYTIENVARAMERLMA